MTPTKNPLLLDIPTELATERIALRTPRAGDGPITTASVRDSLLELKPWMPWATNDYNEQSGEEWCRKAAADFLARKQLQFLMFLRAGNNHIGNIGAFDFHWEVPSCEIGYWLHTAHTGRGLMTEATRALAEMLRAKLAMRRIQIRVDEENEKSRRVAKLAGFQLEGTLRNDCLAVSRRLRNTCVYSQIFAM